MQYTNLFIADLHTNSTVALCKPVVNLDDGGSYHASKGQSWLWYNWQSLMETVDKRKVGPLITHVDGDALEGDIKDRSKQLITRNTATILRMGVDVLEPLSKASVATFIYRGTVAHGGKSGELEEELAADLNAVKCPETNTYSWAAQKFECEGVRFEISHHAKGGAGRPMNQSSNVERLASDTLYSRANNRETIPDLVIRAHLHRFRDSKDHCRVRAIILPAWTLATEYINTLAPLELADIGAVMVHCSAGHYEVEPVRFEGRNAPYTTMEDVINGYQQQ